MQVIRAVGREAAAKKYDLLSAMMAHGLAADKHRQRLVLRLMALITSRYNWQRDELAIGQREIARLWCVDERTVKREMARLRDSGWLVLRRQGARGRVSEYGLGMERLLAETAPHWAAVGPDLVARLGAEAVPAGTDPNVIPFPRNAPTEELPADPGQEVAVEAGGSWARCCRRLRAENPARHAAWLAGLKVLSEAGGQLLLEAPSRFHASYVQTHLMAAIEAAARSEAPELQLVRVLP